MKKAVIVAFDRFTDVDVFLTWDLLNRIKHAGRECQVLLVGTESTHLSVTGLTLATHGRIEECNDADLVLFGSGPGIRDLISDTAYLSRFKLDPGKQLICSMCSGALLFAALGHLKGLSATTYPAAMEALGSFGVHLLNDKHLVTQGNIATAAGCLAAVELVGWAIEKLYDPQVKEAVLTTVLPVGKGQVYRSLYQNVQ